MRAASLAAGAAGVGVATPLALADETCNSPYITSLIKGEEDFLYVWTLGVAGMGDGADKLVTFDVNPASKKFGQVLAQLSVGARGEAHHAGFTDDRHFLWAGGLDDSKIYVFDIYTEPARPKLVKTITDFAARSGLVGPHTYHALPGRMLIGALSNAKDKGAPTRPSAAPAGRRRPSRRGDHRGLAAGATRPKVRSHQELPHIYNGTIFKLQLRNFIFQSAVSFLNSPIRFSSPTSPSSIDYVSERAHE